MGIVLCDSGSSSYTAGSVQAWVKRMQKMRLQSRWQYLDFGVLVVATCSGRTGCVNVMVGQSQQVVLEDYSERRTEVHLQQAKTRVIRL